MGKRADAVVVTENIVFVIEFKAGASEHQRSAFDQVEDYALDLKNFHEGSHSVAIVPVLVSTHAESERYPICGSLRIWSHSRSERMRLT